MRFSERFVGGHDEAGPLITRGHQLEEQVGGLRLKRDVADLVDDEQRVAAQPDQLLLQPAALVGLGEPCHPLRGGGKQYPMPGLTCPDRDPDRQMGLTGPRRA